MRQRSLDIVIDRLGVIDQRLRNGGPYHLGQRFSLVDLTMTYWATSIEPADALDALPALRQCMKLVMERAGLCTWAAKIEALKSEYARMQARGKDIYR